MNEVQQKVKAIREQRGLSQSALAREAGVSFSTISMIERGLRTPSLAALTTIAGALDVDPGEFLPKSHGAGESLELVEARRALPSEAFRASLEGLGLGTLNDLGRALAAEHRAATEARDWHGAAEIYERRGILWDRIQELDPPLCEVKYRPGEPAEVTFYRSPTEQEEEELREKLGEYIVVRDLALA